LTSDLEILIADAIIGGSFNIQNFDGSEMMINLKPGTQFNDKIIFKNSVSQYY